MAIYHLSMKAISRAAGRSATAAAAYRAGCEIADQRTGEIHDYRRKAGVEFADIVLPDGVPNMDRSALWNGVEKHHKRGDALVAREFEVALPEELSPEERKRLANDFARQIANHYQIAADVCIHAPSKDGDERNHHAHILLSACSITPTGFGKKVAELDPIHCQRHKIANPAEHWREHWATLVNERLQANRIDARIDHRSLKEQGIERPATTHKGPAVVAIERRGETALVSARIKQQLERKEDGRRRLEGIGIYVGAAAFYGTKSSRAIEASGSRLQAAGANLDALARTGDGAAQAARNEHARRAGKTVTAAGRRLEQISRTLAGALAKLRLLITLIEQQRHQDMLSALKRAQERDRKAREARLQIETSETTLPLQGGSKAVLGAPAGVSVPQLRNPSRGKDGELEALKAQVLGEGKQVRDVRDGRPYIGQLLHVGQHYAVQHIGMQDVVIHDLEKLPGGMKVGDRVEVRYQAGQVYGTQMGAQKDRGITR